MPLKSVVNHSQTVKCHNLGNLNLNIYHNMNECFYVCLSVHRCICVEKKNRLDATEWFIALIICSACFGHIYANHQELETIQGDSGGICITLGNDSMSDSKQKSSYEHGPDFERLGSYDRLKLGIEGNDY